MAALALNFKFIPYYMNIFYNEPIILSKAGYRLEKEGNLPEALDTYLCSIEIGEQSDENMLYAYRFSYDMAISIARQQNDADTEKKLLIALLRHNLLPEERDMYNQRYKSLI